MPPEFFPSLENQMSMWNNMTAHLDVSWADDFQLPGTRLSPSVGDDGPFDGVYNSTDILYDSMSPVGNFTDNFWAPVDDPFGAANGTLAPNASRISGFTKDELYLRLQPYQIGILSIAYALVFFLGVVGNSLVIAVVVRYPSMQSVTNIFIANLAIADLLVVVICLPVNLMQSIFVEWPMGLFLCKFVPFIQNVSVCASVYSLVAVSYDRFVAIVHVFKKMDTSQAKVVIAGTWIWAVATSIHLAVLFHLEKIPIPSIMEAPADVNGTFGDLNDSDSSSILNATRGRREEIRIIELEMCMSNDPMDPLQTKLSFAVTTLICFIVPLLLITVFYSMILGPIFKRRWLSASNPSEADLQLSRQRKMKAVKMVLVVIISFVVCWAPLYVAMFMALFVRKEIHVVLLVVLQWFGSSNSCINPIIYAFLNARFKNNFVNILKSRSCCGELHEDFAPQRSLYYRSTIHRTVRTGVSHSATALGRSAMAATRVAASLEGKNMAGELSKNQRQARWTAGTGTSQDSNAHMKSVSFDSDGEPIVPLIGKKIPNNYSGAEQRRRSWLASREAVQMSNRVARNGILLQRYSIEIEEEPPSSEPPSVPEKPNNNLGSNYLHQFGPSYSRSTESDQSGCIEMQCSSSRQRLFHQKPVAPKAVEKDDHTV